MVNNCKNPYYQQTRKDVSTGIDGTNLLLSTSAIKPTAAQSTPTAVALGSSAQTRSNGKKDKVQEMM
jgi:hypothetical protein